MRTSTAWSISAGSRWTTWSRSACWAPTLARALRAPRRCGDRQDRGHRDRRRPTARIPTRGSARASAGPGRCSYAGVPVGLGVDGAASNEASYAARRGRAAAQFARAVGGPQAMTVRHGGGALARSAGPGYWAGKPRSGRWNPASSPTSRCGAWTGCCTPASAIPVAALVLGPQPPLELLLVNGPDGRRARPGVLTVDERQVAESARRASQQAGVSPVGWTESHQDPPRVPSASGRPSAGRRGLARLRRMTHPPACHPLGPTFAGRRGWHRLRRAGSGGGTPPRSPPASRPGSWRGGFVAWHLCRRQDRPVAGVGHLPVVGAVPVKPVELSGIGKVLDSAGPLNRPFRLHTTHCS